MKHESKPAAGQMRAKRSVRKPKPKSALAEKRVEPKSSREKVRAYRERMRAKGLRLVQMWVPDTETRDAGGEKQGVRRAPGVAVAKLKSPKVVVHQWRS